MNFFTSVNLLMGMLAISGTISLLQHNATAAEGPCDIYEEGGTPCVAAYSSVRALVGSYDGPLYQVRRTSDNETKDIHPLEPGGYANSEEQDDFLGNSAGTVSKIYDQSGKGNDLTVAKKGCYTGTAGQDDNESDAKGRSLTVGGHDVYAIYMVEQDGYRTNQEGYSGHPDRTEPANGMPTGQEEQSIYEVVDGKRYGKDCCWNFGNASTDNCYGPTGAMNTLFFGTAFWGKGAGSGPWFMNDMEAGVWGGGGVSGRIDGSEPYPVNDNLPSMNMDYAFGIMKTRPNNYVIRVSDATEGELHTAWDGRTPTAMNRWQMQGSVVLGIGGDNSNRSYGTFFEGAIVAGESSDETDEAVFENVKAAGYGKDIVTTFEKTGGSAQDAPSIRRNPSNLRTVISYTLKTNQDVQFSIYDLQGNLIDELDIGSKTAGTHEAIWQAKQSLSGIYIAKMTLDGQNGWTGKFMIGK